MSGLNFMESLSVVDRLRGVAQASESLDERGENDGEKFIVTTRAQAKQMGSHNSEVPKEIHNQLVSPNSDLYFIGKQFVLQSLQAVLNYFLTYKLICYTYFFEY